MADPKNLQELADNLAVLADAATERARQGPNTTGNVSYHAGYREALLDTRSTVLAMIASGREVIRTVHEYPKSYYVIQEGDVGKRRLFMFDRNWSLSDTLGYVQPIDVGKRMYLRDGVLSVENNEQRDKRVAQAELDDSMLLRFHKANPGTFPTGTLPTECVECGKGIKRVPGGHGPTWVHEDTGMVVGP